MKRLLAIILAVSYLCLSIGITVHTHYCMGKLVGTSFIEQDEDHHCTHCGMDKKSSKNGCCKDEHKTIKSATDQVIVKSVSTKFQFCEYLVPIIQAELYSSISISSYNSHRVTKAHAPPLIVSDCPIYILTGNFRV